MFCPQCGRAYEQRVNFCSQCGTALFTPSVTLKGKKLTRSRRDKKIAGVCGGIAAYLDVDTTLVRLVWVMLALVGGCGLLGYLVAWIIMPQEPGAEPTPAAAPTVATQPATNR